MKNDTGYDGWKYIEMTDDEKFGVTAVAKIVDKVIEESGYAPSVRQSLNITFKKATLTISKEEAFSGAWHALADGKPFYRLEISAAGKTIMDAGHDQSAALVFYLMQTLGGGSMSLGGPLVLSHDFRGNIPHKGLEIAAYIAKLKPYVVKDEPKKPSGPALN